MTIRAAVTVALAAALLAASLPAVERARVQHADARVSGELDRLETVARALADENDLVGGDGAPARERVTLHLPVRSWGASGLDELRVSPPSADADVAWTVEGGERRHRQVAGLRVVGPPGGLVLEDGGRQRLVLELTERDGRRTVVVERAPDEGVGSG